MGLSTVHSFLKEGATVYAFDISQDSPHRELADQLNAITIAITIALDLSDSAAIGKAFERIEQEQGKLHSLINATGVNTPNRRATE